MSQWIKWNDTVTEYWIEKWNWKVITFLLNQVLCAPLFVICHFMSFQVKSIKNMDMYMGGRSWTYRKPFFLFLPTKNEMKMQKKKKLFE